MTNDEWAEKAAENLKAEGRRRSAMRGRNSIWSQAIACRRVRDSASCLGEAGADADAGAPGGCSVGLEAAAFELLAGEGDACAEEVAVDFAFVGEFRLQLGDAFFVGLDALLKRGVELFEAAFELLDFGAGFLLGGEEFAAVAEEGADEFFLHPGEGAGRGQLARTGGMSAGEAGGFALG